MKFSKLCARAGRLPTDPDGQLTDDELTVLICSDCPFYHEGQDEELECGAYNLIVHLLRKRVLSVSRILEAVKDEE